MKLTIALASLALIAASAVVVIVLLVRAMSDGEESFMRPVEPDDDERVLGL